MKELINKAIVGILLVAIAVLTGCTSVSTVHVFGKYLTEQEKQKISRVLQLKEYQVEVNDLAFPDAINSDAVVYSPMHSNPEQVRALLDLVAGELNSKAELLYIRSDQHSYTKDNIGLYLFGQAGGKAKRDGRDESISFASPYSASHCASLVFAELILAPKQTFELITVDSATADEVSRKGRWQRDAQQLHLYAETNNEKSQGDLLAVFDVEYLNAQTIADGLRKSILLTPVEGQADIDQCRFSYSIILR